MDGLYLSEGASALYLDKAREFVLNLKYLKHQVDGYNLSKPANLKYSIHSLWCKMIEDYKNHVIMVLNYFIPKSVKEYNAVLFQLSTWCNDTLEGQTPLELNPRHEVKRSIKRQASVLEMITPLRVKSDPKISAGLEKIKTHINHLASYL
jgi:hypothetical protein